MREKMTRREFLKSTGVTAAAIATAGMLAACGGGGDAPASSSGSSGGSSTPASSGSSSSSSGSSSSSASSGSATFDRPHDLGNGLLVCGMRPMVDATVVSGAARSMTTLKTKQIICVWTIPFGNNSTQDITLKTTDFTAKVDGTAAKISRMGIKPVEQVTIKPGETQRVGIGIEVTEDQKKSNGPCEVVLNWKGKKAIFTAKELYSTVAMVTVKFA